MDETTEDETLDDDSELDPRIQDELEKLNKSSAQINELENQLDEIRAAFRQLFSSSTAKIESLAKELGPCVEKARPFYAALAARRDAQNRSMEALNRYDKACSRLSTAKELSHKAEINAQSGGPLSESNQEALNSAISKVNEAEKEKLEAIREHQQAMTTYTMEERRVKEAEDGHKRDIKKAKPYFVMVNRFNASMKEEKTRVQIYEEKVQICKTLYAEALANLEQISEDIHRRRKEGELRRRLGRRGQGVGAELTMVEDATRTLQLSDGDQAQAVAPRAVRSEEEKRALRDRRRSQPPLRPEGESESRGRTESRRRRSSGLAMAAAAAIAAVDGGSLRHGGGAAAASLGRRSSQEDMALGGAAMSNRPRTSHRRTRHRQRQLRISATPIVGFLAETANAHAREAARLQQRASRHQMPVDAWSPAESADSDWAEGASLDGGHSEAVAKIRSEEAAFEAWKQQEARLHEALHSYDGDDEDDVEEAAGLQEISRH